MDFCAQSNNGGYTLFAAADCMTAAILEKTQSHVAILLFPISLGQ